LITDVDVLKAGLMICFKVQFTEIARSLAKARAYLLVTLSAHMKSFGRDHEVFSTARAPEKSLPHPYVNQVGRGDVYVLVRNHSRLRGRGSLGRCRFLKRRDRFRSESLGEEQLETGQPETKLSERNSSAASVGGAGPDYADRDKPG
jgi:predicted amidohydrolase